MNKTIRQEIVWILIVAAFVAGFFLLQGSITGYTILDTPNTPLVDVQIHADVSISPTLEITIPIQQPTATIPKLTYSYIQIKPITESFNYIDIIFKVSNSWIYTNNLDKSEIALYLFDKDWKQLPTSLEKEDNEFTYYKARTTKLGLFTIAKSLQELHIEEPIKIEETKKPITPIFTILIIILIAVLTIELISLLRHKLKFILILLAFALMILGLTIQQPLTKDLLLFGLLPLSITAFILSLILTIILNKLRNYKSYPYIKNIIISVLLILIFITSITIDFNKEVLIYAIVPLICISVIISTLITGVYHLLFKPKKKVRKFKKKKKRKLKSK